MTLFLKDEKILHVCEYICIHIDLLEGNESGRMSF